MKANQKVFSGKIKWLYLEIRIDTLNEKSPLAMEQVIASLHAIHTGSTWGEKFNGKIIPSTTLEIVSLGGRVSFFIKIAAQFRSLLESAIFAQYPKAEIVEVEDYLKNIPKEYDPATADYDFWGTQLNKRKDHANSCYPIRTYTGFEHSEQKTFIDPLSGVLEAMSNIQPYELLATQIIFKPVQPGDWNKGAEEILRKLRGNPKKKTPPSFLNTALGYPLEVISGLVNIVLPAGEPAKPKQVKEEPPSMIQHLSEGQKQVIAAVEHQLSKIAYECKIRVIYLAPKDKFNKALRVPEIIGAYRNFDDPGINGLKPDIAGTATGSSYKYFESLEKPLRDRQTLIKKRSFIVAFKDRDHYKGTGKAYYNTEEVASLFHFPVSPNVRVSQLEKVDTVKTAPPSNLPIGEF